MRSYFCPWLLVALSTPVGALLSHYSKVAKLHTSLWAAGRKRQPSKPITIAELTEKMVLNPDKFLLTDSKKRKNYRRSRKRVTNPKQKYVYSAQRRGATTDNDDEEQALSQNPGPIDEGKEFGLFTTSQLMDPLVEEKPLLRGEIRVSSENGSGAYAYVIQKPAGWSILGGARKRPRSTSDEKPAEPSTVINQAEPKASPKRKQVRVVDDDGSIDVLEYNEADILAVLSPEELAALKEDLGGVKMLSEEESSPVERIENKSASTHCEMLSADTGTGSDHLSEDPPSNLSKIRSRLQLNSARDARFADTVRPSIVGWLKEMKAVEGSPIRGGNFWTAAAGATGVDDSGLVLLVPRASLDSLFCEYVEYVVVVGNGGNVAKARKLKAAVADTVKIETLSKLRKGRGDDSIHTVQVTVPDTFSESSHIVDLCQARFQDGIRGDPNANAFDRRSPRRLIHCKSLAVSSLSFEESSSIETPVLPDDIAVYAERKSGHGFKDGSFLGRELLRASTATNAFREINGAADGYPGWTVDRYDKWLLVQHDAQTPRGPLPSIHDGNTLGVYYLEASADRSSMGTSASTRPILIEGKPAPEFFEIKENGVKYVVNLDRDLSTGIFLDQRPQRTWLRNWCSPNTHVLNCFAHTGAFSVAAAAAGASTVSVDLSRRWLDRLETHFDANDVLFDDRHDAIYGDCFDWLARLSKRGEKFDLVIVDPPSSSVGGRKKKRWSLKNDMDELVALAATLVKPGGLLWTTTNSAAIHPVKFARMCKRGFENAGFDSARLERIQPMPHDFPAIGTQSVKNLVWRL